jgi:hypothetical protein
MWTLVIAAIAMLFVAPGSAVADDHLVPDRSLFAETFLADYDMMLVTALSEAYRDDVRVRAMVIPSFHPESVIGLKEQGTTYRLFCRSPEMSLWAYETLKMMKGPPGTRRDPETRAEIEKLEAALPPDFKDVRVRGYDVEIDADLARQLTDLWDRMLRQTRYPETSGVGLDGVTYHFSLWTKRGQILAGQTWSPPPDSMVGRLAKIVDLIQVLCDCPDETLGARLRPAVQDLRGRLP